MSGPFQYLNQYRIGLLQHGNPLLGDFTQDPDRQPRSGEGMSPDGDLINAQGQAQFPDFILEQFPEWFNQLQLHRIR